MTDGATAAKLGRSADDGQISGRLPCERKKGPARSRNRGFVSMLRPDSVGQKTAPKSNSKGSYILDREDSKAPNVHRMRAKKKPTHTRRPVYQGGCGLSSAG